MPVRAHNLCAAAPGQSSLYWVRMLAPKLRHDGIHLRARAVHAYAVSQPANALDKMRSTVIRVPGKRKWPPHIHALPVRHRVVFISWMRGSRRHHTDNSEGLHVQRDLAPDDVRIRAKARSPQSIAQDNPQSVPRNLLLKIELASQLG